MRHEFHLHLPRHALLLLLLEWHTLHVLLRLQRWKASLHLVNPLHTGQGHLASYVDTPTVATWSITHMACLIEHLATHVGTWGKALLLVVEHAKGLLLLGLMGLLEMGWLAKGWLWLAKALLVAKLLLKLLGMLLLLLLLHAHRGRWECGGLWLLLHPEMLLVLLQRVHVGRLLLLLHQAHTVISTGRHHTMFDSRRLIRCVPADQCLLLVLATASARRGRTKPCWPSNPWGCWSVL